jgi:anthranilate/para-aminobenzoate synthase component I
MIIDLLRNDLGRVCSFGTVRVTCDDKIEEHPTVFHRVATIEGDLEPEYNWADLLRAAFPGGSVTGAPKIRAMQIIDELEPVPRGLYGGALGYLDMRGNLDFCIAIRTLTMKGGRATLQAGAGIVADSDPAAEERETDAKAQALFEALKLAGGLA